MMRIQPPRHGLLLLLVLFVLLALAYTVTVPLGESSDEVSHYAYIQYLVEHHRLPPPEGAVLGEAHQPPLYYVLGALFTAWIPQQDFQVIANPDFVLDDPQTPNYLLHPRSEGFPYHDSSLAWHLVRLLSIAMGAVTVWSTWRTAREYFPPESWMPLAAAALVAFLPGFVFISAVVNNDNLVIALTALGVLQTLRISRKGLTMGDSILLGLVLGLVVLAKLSGLVTWLFSGIMLLWWIIQRGTWRRGLLHAILIFGVATVVTAPWVLYNWMTTGDPLRWSAYLAIITPRREPITLETAAGIVQALSISFWGSFGGALHLKMASPVYWVLNTGALLGILGWAKDIVVPGRDVPPERLYVRQLRQQFLNLDNEKETRSSFEFLLAFLVFWGLLLTAYARWASTDMATGQARLLYPGLPLLAIFLTSGIARLLTKRVRFAVGLWTAGLFGLTVAVLLHLHLLFGAPPANAAGLSPAATERAPFDFGGMIRVTGYQVESMQVAPGGAIRVRIEWQAIGNPQEDYWLLLQLANKEGVVANKDGVPSGGRVTTDWWQSGQLLESRHTLTVPEDIAPGTFILRLGLHPFGRWEWLPVQGAEMLELGKIVVK